VSGYQVPHAVGCGAPIYKELEKMLGTDQESWL